ncbi:BlaI/MecI/CopY family transcriptional regulator [Vulgatibacter sp.]|uniref:BlaI/MecI/CopY family transcriptional regulator n=1 Tax=Vulgatibacter sp. TaxID=1971226 RepID=UPI003566CCAF
MHERRRLEPLGSLEARVMEIVWRLFPATARTVCDRLQGDDARAYTTIMTTLDRLHHKGLLAREKDGLAWRYTPVMSRAAYERALADQTALEILASHGETALAAFVDAAAREDEALLDKLTELIERRRRAGR